MSVTVCSTRSGSTRGSGSTDSGEEEDARTRHLAFYLRFAEKARPELAGPEQGAWLARLDLERENLLAAHAWCDRANTGAETGVRLVHAVKPYWFNRGLLGLGHRTTVGALARAGAQARGLARCVVLADAGQFCMFMGSYREAVGHLVESLAIAENWATRRWSRACSSHSAWPRSGKAM